MSKQKVLFLYLRTGGGHLAPAKAISSYLDAHCAGEVETALVDGLEKSSRAVRFLLEDGYRILQSRARWAYELLYATNKFQPVALWNLKIVSSLVKSHLKEVIRREQPTKIVVLHFFLIKPIYDALREERIDVPVITVVTDPFTAHPMWFAAKDRQFIVFSERLKCRCVELGIPAENLRLFPFPVSERFSQPMSEQERQEARSRFGFSQEKKVVLILGGSDGIPRGAKIVKTLMRAQLDMEIAIVCGQNKSLAAQAERLKHEYAAQGLHIFGFTPLVYDLINIADLVITKCGASTSMEILLMGKIPIVTDYLWEQEKGNVEFIRDAQLGIYEPSLAELPSLVARLVNEDRSAFLSRIRQTGLTNGTPEIARWLSTR